jgi:hypothetical protein
MENNNNLQEIEVSANDMLENLKSKIGKKLVQEISEKPDYVFEVDQEVDLREMDRDEIEKLIFGNVDEVTNNFDNQNDDYLSTLTYNLIKDELESLLDSEFSDEIISVAEKMSVDEDDLKDDLMEDDAFSVSELGCGDHYYVYNYTGDAAVLANTSIFVEIEPGIDLISSLQTLRITSEDYLSAVESHIKKNDHTLQDIKIYLPSEELESDVLAEGSDKLIAVYRDEFNYAVEIYEKTSIFAHSFSHPPVVDVKKLVHNILEVWENGEESLYLHLTCDGDTIKGFGNNLACHGHKEQSQLVLVGGGYLSSSEDPYYVNDSLDIISPIGIKISDFRILGENPDGGDGLLLETNDLQAKHELYKQIYIRYFKDPENINEKQLLGIEKNIDKIVDSCPKWNIDELINMVDSLKSRNYPPSIRLLNYSSNKLQEKKIVQDNPTRNGQELLSVLSTENNISGDMEKHALWLINAGADVSTSTPSGYQAIHYAAKRGNTNLLSALHSAGADLNTEIRYQANPNVDNPLKFLADFYAKNKIIENKKTTTEKIHSFIDTMISMGASLPNGIIKSESRYVTTNTAVNFSVGIGHVGLLGSVLEKEKDNDTYKDTLAAAFVSSVVLKDFGMSVALLNAGTDLNYEYSLKNGKKGLVEDAIDEQNKFYNMYLRPGDMEPFKDLITATRAKRAVESLLRNTYQTPVARSGKNMF